MQSSGRVLKVLGLLGVLLWALQGCGIKGPLRMPADSNPEASAASQLQTGALEYPREE